MSANYISGVGVNQSVGSALIEVEFRLTMNRIVSSRTSEDIERLSGRFTAQETALVDLEKRLRDDQTSLQAMSRAESDDKVEDGSPSERDESLRLTAGLQKVCQDALSATRAKRTGQNFGDM